MNYDPALLNKFAPKRRPFVYPSLHIRTETREEQRLRLEREASK